MIENPEYIADHRNMKHLYSLPHHPTPSPIFCSIVEPGNYLREKLAGIIEKEPGYVCLDVLTNPETCIETILQNPPEVLFMSANRAGIESLRTIKQYLPSLEVLMILRSYETKVIFDSLAAGAAGFINQEKAPTQIIAAIESVIKGGAPMCPQVSRIIVDSFHTTGNMALLTQREHDVLSQLCTGKSYKMVADELCISQDTVRSHIKNIYRKLEVNSKSEAVVKALKNHWV